MTPGDINTLEKTSAAAIAAEDPTGLLMAEHVWLRSVLDEMKSMLRPATLEERSALGAYLATVSARLELHIRKEEEVFFPAVEPLMVEAGQGSTVDMYGEHDAIRIRRDQLVEAIEEGADTPGAFSGFLRSLTVHFENEEELIFAAAPSWLTPEHGPALIAAMQALEDG